MIPVKTLNKHVLHFIEERKTSFGLASGKMGICIYFYYLSRIDQNVKYKKIADKLIDDIFENINLIDSIDIKNGLAGIGLGIDYLIKNNYINGNINIILKDIDDVIYKNLSYRKYYEKFDPLVLTHILYYLTIRLESQKKDSENEYLFRELIIQTVNNLYERIDLSFYEEPLTYNIDYRLPQFLYVLGKIYKHDFYHNRLIKIIEGLRYKVLSVFPILHSNRLYLLWGMNALNKEINDKNWENHIRLINDQISVDIILDYELRDKNIFFNDGFTSIYLMLSSLTEVLPKLSSNKYKIQKRIKESGIWNSLTTNPQYIDRYTGLYDGFTGVSLLLKHLESLNI